MLNSKLYDVLKYIMQIVLPAVGTLYFTLSQTLALPYGTEVVGTITAVNLFLGSLLKVSSTVYNNSDAKYDGDIHVDENTGTASLSSEDLAAAVDAGKKEVVLKVRKAAIKKTANKPGKTDKKPIDSVELDLP